MKPQKKNAGGRKSEQHPYHPHPKPSSVQIAVGCALQESVSTATNEHARIDHQPSQQSSPIFMNLTEIRHAFFLWFRTACFSMLLYCSQGVPVGWLKNLLRLTLFSLFFSLFFTQSDSLLS